MRIVDLTPEEEQCYFCCLEEWSEEMKDAGPHKEVWYRKMQERGLRVKLALDDSGTVGGMIQYSPIEYSFTEGQNLYFIHCIWVHGYKKGRGDFRKKGMGRALLKAAEEDAKSIGAGGIVAWGLSLPFFMRASWFRKHGYKKCDKHGMAVLLWKKFNESVSAPTLIKPKKKPERVAGQVTVSAFINGWCPAQNIVYERARRVASALGEKVVFKKYETFNRDLFMEWGISDALYIDDKLVSHGPPLKYEKIERLVVKRLRKLR